MGVTVRATCVTDTVPDIMNDSMNYPSDEFSEGTQSDPIAVLLASTGYDRSAVGTTFTLGVTITNRGSLSSTIEIWIEELSSPISQWVVNNYQNLALASDRSGEVRFQFNIPIDAREAAYRYRLKVKANAYGSQPVFKQDMELEVAQSLLTSAAPADPTLTVLRSSRSDTPISLLPGTETVIPVQVLNRSPQVDRFRLDCRDLPREWVTITYPNDDLGIGTVDDADSLPLNPGEVGTITVTFAPPLDALADSYLPSLRLFSEADPDLTLLEPVYLQVEPVYQLQAQLISIHTNVGGEVARYRLQLSNSGNSDRLLDLGVIFTQDDAPCSYVIEAEELRLAPKQTRLIGIQLKPKPARKRPLFGGGQLIDFQVTLRDRQQLPIETPTLPGALLWKTRPWWQLFPFILVIVALLIALAIVILRWLFFPPAPPRIASFEAAETNLAVSNGDVVSLDWEIERAHRIASLEVIGRSPDGNITSDAVTYDFRGGLPPELEPFCLQDRNLLSCTGVRTDARRAGDYIFDLTVTPRRTRRSRPSSEQSELILLAPPPRIADFEPSTTIYDARFPVPTAPEEETDGAPAPAVVVDPTVIIDPSVATIPDEAGITLNWRVSRPEQLQNLQILAYDDDGATIGAPFLYSFRQGIPDTLLEECVIDEFLVCENVPTGIREIGSYNFQLQISPSGPPGSEPGMRRIGPVTVEPPPQVLQFAVNGDSFSPKIVIPFEETIAPPPLAINWEVTGREGTTVQLLPSPGDVPLVGNLSLPLSTTPTTLNVMLQVSSPSGDQIVRSIAIETVAIPPAIVIPPEPEPEPPPEPADPLTAPVQVDPDTLSPFSHPTRYN